MNDTIEGQYRIIGYIDDLEEAERRVKAQNLSDDIIKEIDALHDALVDMQPLLTTTEDNDTLKEYLEGLIGKLVLISGEGKVDKIQELVKVIADKIEKLKEAVA